MLDYDAGGNLVGIDIDDARLKVDLKKFTWEELGRRWFWRFQRAAIMPGAAARDQSSVIGEQCQY